MWSQFDMKVIFRLSTFLRGFFLWNHYNLDRHRCALIYLSFSFANFFPSADEDLNQRLASLLFSLCQLEKYFSYEVPAPANLPTPNSLSVIIHGYIPIKIHAILYNTSTGCCSKSNLYILSIKHNIKSFHYNSSNYCTTFSFGDRKLVTVLTWKRASLDCLTKI